MPNSQNKINGYAQAVRDLTRVETKQRLYIVELKHHEHLELLQGRIHYFAVVRNTTAEVVPLFFDKKVSSGTTTIPRAFMPNLPKDPKKIFSFDGLEVNGKPIQAQVVVEYVDKNEKGKGIRRDINCEELIQPGATSTILVKEAVLFDDTDFLTRRFWNISVGPLKVEVHHPRDIGLDINWVSRTRTDLKRKESTLSTSSSLFLAEGRWMPGSGFTLLWKPKES